MGYDEHEFKGPVDYGRPLTQEERASNEAFFEKLKAVFVEQRGNLRMDGAVIVGTHIVSNSTCAWQLTIGATLFAQGIQHLIMQAKATGRIDLMPVIARCMVVHGMMEEAINNEAEMIGRFYSPSESKLDPETEKELRRLLEDHREDESNQG